MEYYAVSTSNVLQHHGVLGQKWGVRRFQNTDGSLTAAGKQKLAKYKEKESIKVHKRYEGNASMWRPSGIKRMDVEIARNKARAEKLEAKGKIERAKKYSDWAKDIERGKKLAQSMMNKELSAISKMSYSDMKKEKAATIKEGAKCVAKSLAETAALSAVFLPTTGFSVISVYTPTGQQKTNLRISNKDQQKLVEKANSKTYRRFIAGQTGMTKNQELLSNKMVQKNSKKANDLFTKRFGDIDDTVKNADKYGKTLLGDQEYEKRRKDLKRYLDSL